MQEASPKVLKQRQDKYEKLVRMIRGFQRTHQELKLLDKIKSDTVFEISLRYRRCEANKTYRFPKTAEANEPDSEQEDNEDLVSDKELVYNLHSQNKQRIDPILQRQRIKLLEIEEASLKRQKTQANSSSTTRVHSLGTQKTRPSRQRIDRVDRIEKLHILVEKQRLRTERASEKKLKSQRSITKMPGVIKGIINSEALSTNQSNHASQIKAFTIPVRAQVCKTEVSPIKFERSRRKIKLATEESETSLHKTSNKKLYTEESGIETTKKGRMYNFLSNQIKKAEKIVILNGLNNTQKLKPKNLFQKQVY